MSDQRGRERVEREHERERLHLVADDEQHAADRLERDDHGRRDLRERHAEPLQIPDELAIAHQLHRAAPEEQHGEQEPCEENDAGIDGTRHA
ncbi:hypothetical protein DP49_5029 [Burkholderia pseudomallei]|nr:hypothetical protein DP49_5029 [Burkholderia pseudomallei]